MGPEEAKARRLDGVAALQLGEGNPAEQRRRAAGCHDTQEARHDAHTHQEEHNRTGSTPPGCTEGAGGYEIGRDKRSTVKTCQYLLFMQQHIFLKTIFVLQLPVREH